MALTEDIKVRDTQAEELVIKDNMAIVIVIGIAEFPILLSGDPP